MKMIIRETVAQRNLNHESVVDLRLTKAMNDFVNITFFWQNSEFLDESQLIVGRVG